MFPEPPSVTQLSQVIAQVTAPAFFLGAVAAFISGLTIRLNRIVDRSQALNEIRDVKGRLKSDIPRLEHRAHLLNRAMLSSTISAIIASSRFVCECISERAPRVWCKLAFYSLGRLSNLVVDFRGARNQNRATGARIS